jgi:hypothetical protein
MLRQLGKSASSQAAPIRASLPRGMNKLEKRYADHLDFLKRGGEITAWWYECVRFRIGAGAQYKPDFIVLLPDGKIEVHETKGFRREAAMVRIKAAAERYAPIPFFLVRVLQGRWCRTRVGEGR